MNRSTIPVSVELKKKLDAIRGDKSWNEFLEELLNLAIGLKVSEVENFLRSSAKNRDIPFEKAKLRLKDEESSN